jgi:hypothetical protein
MNELTPKKYNSREFNHSVVQALRQRPTGSTVADIVVLTGLPVTWVAYTLRELLGVYPCRLRLNEKDELLYVFDLGKSKKPWKDALLGTYSQTFHPTRPRTWLQKTASYIFGEAKRKKDQLFLEKIILQYIRHNGGRVVVAELIQITGWSIYEAETCIARLLADYDGEVEVTAEGVIIYHFDSIAEITAESTEIAQSLKVWERPVPEWKLNLNDDKSNQLLEYLHWKNLQIASPTALGSGAGLIFLPEWSVLSLSLGISLSTLAFSAAFFLVPALRRMYLYYINEQIRLKNVENFVLKGIFTRIQSQITPEKDLKKMLYGSKPDKTYSYWWNQAISNADFEFALVVTPTFQREGLLAKKALELEADISIDAEGNLVYDFERLKTELRAVQESV